MTWHARFTRMRKAMGLSLADVAAITGHTPDSMKSMTQANVEFPRHLRLCVVVWERLSGIEDATQDT